MPWEKKPEQKSATFATVGAVACYKAKFASGDDEESDDESRFQFTKIWVKGYPVQTGSLFWSESENVLYVGFDDGKISRLLVTNYTFKDVSLNSLTMSFS
jgi:hypothetical protein